MSKGVNFSSLKGFVRIKMAWKDYQPANQLKRELEFVLTHPHPFWGPSCKKCMLKLFAVHTESATLVKLLPLAF